VNIGMKPGIARFVFASAGAAFAPALAISFALCFAAGVAEAHGGGPGLTYDPCMQQTGADDFIHLAVYQPDFNPFAEYCDALPKGGRTLLVFDLIGIELPKASVSLEVFQQDGRLQRSVPLQRYRSGVADLRLDLPPGKYTVLVRVDEPGGWRRLAFPLAVGAWWGRLIMPLLIVLLIGLVTAGYCLFQIKGMASERGDSPMKTRIGLRSVSKS
jgi:hypothetical protein